MSCSALIAGCVKAKPRPDLLEELVPSSDRRFTSALAQSKKRSRTAGVGCRTASTGPSVHSSTENVGVFMQGR